MKIQHRKLFAALPIQEAAKQSAIIEAKSNLAVKRIKMARR